MAVITTKDILPFQNDNTCRTNGEDLTSAIEDATCREFLCTDLDEGWELEGEKVNAAPLHPQYVGDLLVIHRIMYTRGSEKIFVENVLR